MGFDTDDSKMGWKFRCYFAIYKNDQVINTHKIKLNGEIKVLHGKK